MNTINTLVDLINQVKNEDNKGITIIKSQHNHKYVSYKNLYHSALNYLSYFRNNNFKPGQQIIFQINDNEQFIYSFWGCILGKMIPVILPMSTNNEKRCKLQNISLQLTDYKILVTNKTLNSISTLTNYKKKLLNIDAITKNETSMLSDLPCTTSEDDVAFIQFSSGSTGNPKGIVLTNKNLITSINSTIIRAGLTKDDCMFSWLPITHDMGLIGFHLIPIGMQGNQCIMDTSLFIEDPTSWMDNACKHQATILCSPNFGYNLFLQKLNSEYNFNWNLSNVRLIFNGAEPIDPSTCKKFMETMKKYNLKSSAMFPAYGLAEASLAVTFPIPGKCIEVIYIDKRNLCIGEPIHEVSPDHKFSLCLTSLGSCINNMHLRITNESTQELAENIIGNVEINGDAITKGYINNPKANLDLFSEDGWLKTGDIGFLKNNKLYITGRKKDIIFINGQNYYSHDLEKTLADSQLIQKGNVCITSVYIKDSSKEEILAFVVFNKSLEDFIPLYNKLKKYTFVNIGLNFKEIIPVSEIPKTTSGKLKRYILCENYINGEYDNIITTMKNLLLKYKNSSTQKKQLQEKILTLFRKVLENQNISINDNIFDLGLDSFSTIVIVSQIEKEFKIKLELENLTNSNSIYDFIENLNLCQEE